MLNIIFSDFLISSIGIFIDIIGMLQAIGTSMRGRQPEFVLCQFEGFFYMTSGNYRFIYFCLYNALYNFWVWFELSKEYICNKLLGMASLLSTVTFSVVRLIIMKSKTNAWVGRCEFSFKNTVALQLIWFLALTFSVPPLFYFGRYGKNMVGIR